LVLVREGRLAAAASRRGVSVEALAREALERTVGYDGWKCWLASMGGGTGSRVQQRAMRAGHDGIDGKGGHSESVTDRF
jgi:hypothetical protein